MAVSAAAAAVKRVAAQFMCFFIWFIGSDLTG